MSEVKHTPGPWTVLGEGIYCADNWFFIADVPVNFAEHSGVQEANARLIAAAPELLEALQELLEVQAELDAEIAERKARAAIAKATGETE